MTNGTAPGGRSPPAWGAGALVAGTVALAVFFTVVLASARFERALFEVATSRLEAIADEVSRKIDYGLTFGLDLTQLTDLDAVAAGAARLPGVSRVDILDARGTVVFSSDQARRGVAVETNAACSGPASGPLMACAALQDSLGKPAGRVIVEASSDRLRTMLADVNRAVGWRLFALAASVALIALIVTIRVIPRTGGVADDNSTPQKTALRLTLIAAALLIGSSALASRELFLRYNPLFEAELVSKAETVADRLSRQIDRALKLGIPLARLDSASELFAHEVRRWPDIAYAALRDDKGRILAAAGRPARIGDAPQMTGAAPERLYAGHVDIRRRVSSPGQPPAFLHVGIDEAQLARDSTNLALEFLAVGIVSILLTFEILLVASTLATRRLNTSPGEQKSSGGAFELAFLRLPVFLFCMAEELSRPSLPSYARSFGDTAPWLSPDLVVSLPITLFMLVWGFSQPKGARWSERWGRGRTMAVGSALAVAGLTLTAFSGSLMQLMLWRGVTALGYGMFLISSQGMIVDNTESRTRARGLSTFIGALLAAGVCGPLVGGVLADHAGVPATFLTGAGLAAASGIAVLLWAAPSSAKPRATSAPAARGVLRTLLLNRGFMALMILSAAPAKIAATSLLFFLVPLLMKGEGANNAEIGRVQMLYFLCFILVSPLAARLSDRWNMRGVFVVMGGLGAFASLAGAMLGETALALAVGVALFGFFQSLIGAPQLTLVSEMARSAHLPETVVIGWYRLIERLGGAAGPLLAGGLAAFFSYRGALLGIGLTCGVTAALYLILHLTMRRTATGEGSPP